MVNPVRIEVYTVRMVAYSLLGLLLTAIVSSATVKPPLASPQVVAALVEVVDEVLVDVVDEVVEVVIEWPAPQTARRAIDSLAISRQSPYLVYLPPDYDLNPDRRYPVLYMLHGVGGNDPMGEFWEWEDDQRLFTQADRLIRLGLIDPMIIVLPQGEDSYFVNHADSGPQWGDFIALELVPAVDAQFRTLAHRDARAVGGLSMGGQAALQLGMNYPSVFGIVGAHSPTIREVVDRPWYMGDEDFYRNYDPVQLVKDKPAIARTLNIWLDVGNADEVWKPVVDKYAQLLRELDIPFTYASFAGEHHGDYWRESAPEYLRFYDQAFKQNLTLLES